MKIETTPTTSASDDGAIVAFLCREGRPLPPEVRQIDRETDGAVSRAVEIGGFKAGANETLPVFAAAKRGLRVVLLVGTGQTKAVGEALAYERAAATSLQAAARFRSETLELHLGSLAAPLVARVALGVHLASYRFAAYRKALRDDPPKISTVQLVVENPGKVSAGVRDAEALAEAVAFTRDLVSEPANRLFPREFAARLGDLGRLGLEVEVKGEIEMRELGMGALLGVGQGSGHESQLVVLNWRGGPPGQAPIGLVGKGVCFDSGGISIKAKKNMQAMKWDMAGAAAVAGTLRALAVQKTKVNVVGVLPLVENMPDGAAQRPGDIVTSMSGQTIEITDTDAEGRLILSDALWYCHQTFNPRAMVDIATLTGAVQAALGKEYAGIFANDDPLAAALTAAGEEVGERLWRLPLTPAYEKQIESLAADMLNCDDSDMGGGACTAAIMLQRFTAGRPWAHLDIAGVAWRDPSVNPTSPAGATGYGVRLLTRFAQSF